ncbi:hypothetical protein [Carnobacterium funditum]|uniref:hypothetical protein n=1 Tax=Carnobacterium funditum TaxID=2752 RepID=UPI0005527ACF|nr:hypothetical protein [Carnobacterium funditum]
MIKVKQNSKLMLILSIILVLFLFTPSLSASAHFKDSVSTEIGIQLKLGNLALLPANDETVNGIAYSGNTPLNLSSHVLKNSGTLNGKVAYKITVSEKDSAEPAKDTDNVKVILEADSNKKDMIQSVTTSKTGEYTFLKNTNGDDYILVPDQNKELPISIAIQSDAKPEKDLELEVTVTFLLVLANAAEPTNTGFHDTVSFKHLICQIKLYKISSSM